MSDTPKTDAASYLPADIGNATESDYVVPIECARDLERQNAELLAALKPFAKTQEVFDQCDQIRDLITKISHNPVNGVSAWLWWLNRHLSVFDFQNARAVFEKYK